MNFSKLLAYGALGIITGLLIENKLLNVRQRAVAKALQNKRKIKKEARKMVHAAYEEAN